ncbi:MAG: hypothetical protein U0Y82_14935 [Thermoleophilia bacterium]
MVLTLIPLAALAVMHTNCTAVIIFGFFLGFSRRLVRHWACRT